MIFGKDTPAAEPSTMAVRRLDRGSEFGRQVAVDFEADADLDKSGGRPREGRVSFILIHRYSPYIFVKYCLNAIIQSTLGRPQRGQS